MITVKVDGKFVLVWRDEELIAWVEPYNKEQQLINNEKPFEWKACLNTDNYPNDMCVGVRSHSHAVDQLVFQLGYAGIHIDNPFRARQIGDDDAYV